MARVLGCALFAAFVVWHANAFTLQDALNHFRTTKTETRETSTPPTEPSDFLCIQDGLYKNPGSCSSYLQCSNGQAYYMPCPAGLQFSTVTEQCESPCDAFCDPAIACNCLWPTCTTTEISHVTRSPERSQEYVCVKDGVFPDLENCNHYIYCSNGVVHYLPCPEGLHYNAVTDRCESPCDAHCDQSMASECGWPSSTTTETSHETRAPERSQEYACVKDGVYPDLESCNHYIHCSNGVAHYLTCPEGLHYNAVADRCESPCDAHCDQSMALECGWPSSTDDVCSLPSDMGNCNYYFLRWFYDTSSSECIQFIYGGCKGNRNNFRTKSECEKRCVAERGFPSSNSMNRKLSSREFAPEYCSLSADKGPCPALVTRYFYDPDTGLCHEFMYGGCLGNANNFKRKDQCEKTCGKGYESEEFTCTADGVYPVPERCSLYVQCLKGEAHFLQCPSGLHYSTKTERCELPCNAFCEQSLACDCEWPSCKQSGSSFECTEDGLYPDPSSCSSYIQCSNGIAYNMPCPTGLHFSNQTERCEQPCEAYCDQSIACKCDWPTCIPPEFKCEKNGLYPDKSNCSSYIQCSNGIAYYMPCPTGLHFSERNGRCEQPCEAHCDQSIACKCGWKSCRSNSEEFTCTADGVYPVPERCSLYAQCLKGEAHFLQCPSGLHYSTKTERCELPCNAFCEQSLACDCEWPSCTSSPPLQEMNLSI